MKIVFFGSSSFVIPILDDIHQQSGKKLKNLIFERKDELLSLNYTTPNILDLFSFIENNQGLDLLEGSIKLCGVVTQPDTQNRGKITKNPVSQWAFDHGVKLFQPLKLNKEEVAYNEFAEQVDIGITASFGQIISENILNIPKFGMINWHPSLLPAYRGATPIQSLVMNGDEETGLSWIIMEKEMDAGNILVQTHQTIEKDVDFETLSQGMGELGRITWVLAAFIQTLEKSGLFRFSMKQNDEKATFTQKLSKDDSLIDIHSYSSQNLYNRWRGLKSSIGVVFSEDSYFYSKVRLDELVQPSQDVQNFNKTNIITFENKNWILVKSDKQNLVFLKCLDSFIEVKRITLLHTGKQVDFKGFQFNPK